MHVLVFAVGIKVVVTSTNCKLGCSKNPEQVPPPHQLQIAEFVKEILQLFFHLQIKRRSSQKMEAVMVQNSTNQIAPYINIYYLCQR